MVFRSIHPSTSPPEHFPHTIRSLANYHPPVWSLEMRYAPVDLTSLYVGCGVSITRGGVRAFLGYISWVSIVEGALFGFDVDGGSVDLVS